MLSASANEAPSLTRSLTDVRTFFSFILSSCSISADKDSTIGSLALIKVANCLVIKAMSDFEIILVRLVNDPFLLSFLCFSSSVIYVGNIQDKLQGSERLGHFVYRARWIKFGAGDDEVLAYSIRQNRSPFSRSGAIVLRLDGRVEWISKDEFEKLLAEQQSQLEIEMTKNK